jgi:DNA-binding beta-propeller fold protein YncE
MKNYTLKKLGMLTAMAVLLAGGCKKDDDNDNDGFSGNGVFVICEGAFQQGNGRLDFYNTETNTLFTDIYQTANELPLGDVFQSMSIIDGKAYLVVNNSGKIEVANASDVKSTGTITGFTSPRYLCLTGTNKAYVSDLFSGEVSIVNTQNLTITGSIPLSGWTEEMLLDNGNVWITNANSNYTFIAQNDAVVDSVNVGYGSSSIRKDNGGKIWILTGGNYLDNTASKLVKLDASTKAIEWDYELNTYGASKLRMNAEKTFAYFLFNGKVYRKNTADSSNPEEFISISGKSFYGIGVNPANGDIWLGDAGDFSSAGTVYVYSAAGSQLSTFTTGVAPTDFVF